MKRKEKPVQTNTHELTDKEYAEYKHQEKEKRKEIEQLKKQKADMAELEKLKRQEEELFREIKEDE